MIDLAKAKEQAALLDDNDEIAVKGRWLRQVIRELTEARECLEPAAPRPTPPQMQRQCK